MAFFNRPNEAENAAEGTLEFKADQGGVYSICFDNSMSRWTPKVATFEIPYYAKDDNSQIAQLEHLGPMVDSVIKISDQLEVMEKLQHSMRVREQLHRDSESLFSFFLSLSSFSSFLFFAKDIVGCVVRLCFLCPVGPLLCPSFLL